MKIFKCWSFRLFQILLLSTFLLLIFPAAAQDSPATGEKNALKSEAANVSTEEKEGYNSFLISVPKVEVKTAIGHLPRLPRYLDGVYMDGVKGPKVRVVWPAPSDNAQVLNTGTYEVVGNIAGSGLRPVAQIEVVDKMDPDLPQKQLVPFPLHRVTLNTDSQGSPTQFMLNRDKFLNTLYQTNPDSFLFMFRDAFGQPQPEGAFPLGVWDSRDTKLRGHATGHYLSALAQAYAGSDYDVNLQATFRQKMEYMVGVLYELSQLSGTPYKLEDSVVSDPTQIPPGSGKTDFTSDLTEEGIRHDFWNWGEGFISAYPPDQFIMLEQGAKYGTGDDKIWAPYYTLHKLLAGLMDVYDISGDTKALEIVTGMSNWVHARLSRVPTETLIGMWDTYIAGEFGGMNEAMARLSGLTGDAKYLDVARMFDNITVFYGDAEHSHGLSKNVDTFRGLHANQHIPQMLGALELYEHSNIPEYFSVADNFWHKATADYMYSIGGVAGAQNPTNPECFIAQPSTLFENGFSEGGQNETCATYNMLKLSADLFMYQPQGEIMDYYERGLYNHILASVAEDSPANTYHVPLGPGSEKQFGNPDMTGFTCCNGTALESNTKFQNSIYYNRRDDSALYVNLFIPSTLEWEERGVKIIQSTAFPNEGHTQLEIHGSGDFDLMFRVPGWATSGIQVAINGHPLAGDFTPGTYANLGNSWKNGDIISITLPMEFRLEPLMDNPNIASLFYGPILLAAQENETLADWHSLKLNPTNIGSKVDGDAEILEFQVDGTELLPFYKIYGRHSAYFKLDLNLKK
ncbi:glycoside hydrolase family 127 protein [Robiginitalea sp.]|nr:glycoside hydrolase family 127 protein [Robiginitalea sp.]